MKALIVRLVTTVMLVIIGFTAANLLVVLLRPGNIARLTDDLVKNTGRHAAGLETYVWASVALALVCAALMLALGLNVSFLRGRLFRRRITGVAYVVTIAVGAASLLVGFAGSAGLGAQVLGGLLPAILCFVVLSVLAPGFLAPRPALSGGPSGGDAARPPASGQTKAKGRQRRGGRNR